MTIDDFSDATRRTRASITPAMWEAFTSEVAVFERV